MDDKIRLQIYKHMLKVVKNVGQSTILLEKLINSPYLKPEDVFDELVTPQYFYYSDDWLNQ